MLNVAHALIFLIKIAFSLWIWALLLRFFLQKARASYHDQISQLLLRVTEWLIKPTKRYLNIKPWHDFDLVILGWAFIFSCLEIWVIYSAASIWLITAPSLTLLPVLITGFLSLIRRVIDLFFYAILIQSILSWFPQASTSPYYFLLCRVTAPLLAPFRRFIPPISGMDLSPLWAIILLQVLSNLLPFS